MATDEGWTLLHTPALDEAFYVGRLDADNARNRAFLPAIYIFSTSLIFFNSRSSFDSVMYHIWEHFFFLLFFCFWARQSKACSGVGLIPYFAYT